MTRKERAKRLKQLLTEHLSPQCGGRLFIEVAALSASCLLVEVLNQRDDERQTFVQVKIHEPNVVQKIHDFLTREDGDAQEPSPN
jgi:hypothetical protein